MGNPNLVRKVSDSPSGTAGEISPASVFDFSNKGRNYIINGDMRIAQRGTSFAAIALLSTAPSQSRYAYHWVADAEL